MKKRLFGLALFLVLSVSAVAQDSINVQATPLHRFRVNNATLGHYLTPDFNGGVVLNYAFQPFPAQADIVPLVPGYAPRADWDDSTCSCQFVCFPYCNQY